MAKKKPNKLAGIPVVERTTPIHLRVSSADWAEVRRHKVNVPEYLRGCLRKLAGDLRKK